MSMEGCATSVTKVGLFRTDVPFDRKQLPVMQILAPYYTPDVLRKVLIPVIAPAGEGVKLSLRALDWLVTNYSKKFPIVYKIKPEDMPEKLVNVYTEYKTWLWKYRRSHFDPFRRRQRISFSLDGVTYNTTVGQLNFMHWASRYGVLEYARNHIQAIEKDHAEITKTKHSNIKDDNRTQVKSKRRRLSTPAGKKVLVFGEPVTVCFTPGGKNTE